MAGRPPTPADGGPASKHEEQSEFPKPSGNPAPASVHPGLLVSTLNNISSVANSWGNTPMTTSMFLPHQFSTGTANQATMLPPNLMNMPQEQLMQYEYILNRSWNERRKRPAPSSLPQQVQNQDKSKRRRKYWAPVEEACLKLGVQELGEGRWVKILHKYKHVFQNRNSVDLKDKWRNMKRQICRQMKEKESSAGGAASKSAPENKTIQEPTAQERSLTTALPGQTTVEGVEDEKSGTVAPAQSSAEQDSAAIFASRTLNSDKELQVLCGIPAEKPSQGEGNQGATQETETKAERESGDDVSVTL